ncbi:pirin family protein [Knoellia remsis]|nr:pirin family protein [Knoellia remsis]
MTDVKVLAPREVPLGGPRSMTVRRTLPHRDRSFVGAWCFVDHYGPDDVSTTGGMDVPPHPHTGLQTVSWLFEGEIEHRDTAGVHEMVRPGEVNLMTSGHGIAHSEVSTPETRTLHGVQLWVVLPEVDRDMGREFQHHAAPSVPLGEGCTARVFIGTLAGHTSPVQTRTPLLGAELTIADGATVTLDVDTAYEHGLLVDTGEVTFAGQRLGRGDLGIVEAGASTLTLEAHGDVRAVLLGGTPYDEEIVMWWNFIGRNHDEVVAFREQWQARSERFGEVEGYAGRLSWLPAPDLPRGELRPRTRTGRH